MGIELREQGMAEAGVVRPGVIVHKRAQLNEKLLQLHPRRVGWWCRWERDENIGLKAQRLRRWVKVLFEVLWIEERLVVIERLDFGLKVERRLENDL